jgi:hypothetical protein
MSLERVTSRAAEHAAKTEAGLAAAEEAMAYADPPARTRRRGSTIS